MVVGGDVAETRATMLPHPKVVRRPALFSARLAERHMLTAPSHSCRRRAAPRARRSPKMLAPSQGVCGKLCGSYHCHNYPHFG